MDADRTSDLDDIAPEEWSSLVRAAVGSDRAEIVALHGEPIFAGKGAGTRLYRVTGTAAVGGPAPVEWSMVVKVFTFDVASYETLSREPTDWNYWKREWLVYQSAWQQGLSGSIEAPRCFGHGENRRAANENAIAWIAIEDLGEHAQAWRPPTFGVVARQVGKFNAQHVDDSRVANEPWLTSRWLRGWTEQSAVAIQELPSAVHETITRRVLAAEIAGELLSLWANRDRLFAVLDRLPTTLAHNDVFPRNVFLRGAGRSVVVDWAYTGPAPVGAELAAMVGASQVFFGSPPRDWEELERECLAGYTRGLREAGYAPDAADLEAGYLLSYVLRFGVGALAPTLSLTSLPAGGREEVARTIGSYEAVIDNSRQCSGSSTPESGARTHFSDCSQSRKAVRQQSLALIRADQRSSMSYREKRSPEHDTASG